MIPKYNDVLYLHYKVVNTKAKSIIVNDVLGISENFCSGPFRDREPGGVHGLEVPLVGEQLHQDDQGP